MGGAAMRSAKLVAGVLGGVLWVLAGAYLIKNPEKARNSLAGALVAAGAGLIVVAYVCPETPTFFRTCEKT